jgi:hypothetical protein
MTTEKLFQHFIWVPYCRSLLPGFETASKNIVRRIANELGRSELDGDNAFDVFTPS